MIFHDGSSKGTLRDISLLRKTNKGYEYYKIEDDIIELAELSDIVDIDAIDY